MMKAKRDHFFLVMVQSILAIAASLAVLLSLPAWPTAIDAHREVSPETAAGWLKHEGNPVLGGKLGTCFDVSLLKEGRKYRMWFSWRPRKSIGLVESTDGIHWSDPVICLAPNPGAQWEDDVNRQIVVKRSDGYSMWYTGQAKGHSWIGYARSRDGNRWERSSPRSEEHTSELQSPCNLVCRLLLEKKK